MKKCFKCNQQKELCEYYRHLGMSDGRLGKCKTCTKSDSQKNHNIKRLDPDWVAKERVRHKEKSSRLGYSKYSQKKRDFIKENGGSSGHSTARARLGIIDPDVECHHWSYKKEYQLDVFLLTKRNHKLLHKELTLTKDLIFITNCGILLNTKEKHRTFIENFF